MSLPAIEGPDAAQRLLVGEQFPEELPERLGGRVVAAPQRHLGLGVQHRARAGAVALVVVGVQQAVGRPAVDGGGQLPGEVDRVEHAALSATPVAGNRWAASPASRIRPARYRSACRAWNVKRVSRSWLPQRQVRAEHAADAVPELGQGHRLVAAGPGGIVLGGGDHQDPGGDRPEREDAAVGPGEARADPARPGDVEVAVVRARSPSPGTVTLPTRLTSGYVVPGNGMPASVADPAARAVAAHQVPGGHPVRPVRPVHLRGHRRVVLAHPGDLVPAADAWRRARRRARASRRSRRGLREHHRPHRRIRQGREVRVQAAEREPGSGVGARAGRAEPFQQPPVAQQLQDLPAQAAGLRGFPGLRVTAPAPAAAPRPGASSPASIRPVGPAPTMTTSASITRQSTSESIVPGPLCAGRWPSRALRSRGSSPGMTSPSLRVVRVSATYRSARPRGDACSIPAGSTMTTESNSSPLACSGVRTATGASRSGPGGRPSAVAVSSTRADGAITATRPAPISSASRRTSPARSARPRRRRATGSRRQSRTDSGRVGARRQERGCQRHDGLGGAVVDGQPRGAPAPGGDRVKDLCPRVGAGRRGGLRQVADDGHGPGRAAAQHHAPVHRGQLLRLVDDHVPVGPGPVSQRPLGEQAAWRGLRVPAGDPGHEGVELQGGQDDGLVRGELRHELRRVLDRLGAARPRRRRRAWPPGRRPRPGRGARPARRAAARRRSSTVPGPPGRSRRARRR